MKKTTIIWLVAIFITLFAAYYQKVTGPTYPKKMTAELKGIEYKYKMLRSSDGNPNCLLKLIVPDTSVHSTLVYRHYPSNEEWISVDFVRNIDTLIALLPQQPAAGKLQYYIDFKDSNSLLLSTKDQAAVIRFRDPVPAWALIPHVLFIFLAMLFSNVAGIMAAMKESKFRLFMFVSFALLLLGGAVFGPIVQKYSFGEYWTGIPWGWDLTDNKTLIAMIAWAVAVALNWKTSRPVWVIVAMVVELAIFAIPHSMFGSELNHETGKIIQGMIMLF